MRRISLRQMMELYTRIAVHPDLTRPQSRVLAFIEARVDAGASPPTCREISAHMNYKSPRAATEMLDRLEEQKYIARDAGRARGIRLLKRFGVPFIGSVPAGLPLDSVTLEGERLPINPALFGIADRSRAFALRVRGDSMEGRHIFDGDIVLLESDATPRHESIVAALIDHESTLKTLLLRRGKAWLRAENPRYPDLIPAWDLQIQGVARAVIRHLPT